MHCHEIVTWRVRKSHYLQQKSDADFSLLTLRCANNQLKFVLYILVQTKQRCIRINEADIIFFDNSS